ETFSPSLFSFFLPAAHRSKSSLLPLLPPPQPPPRALRLLGSPFLSPRRHSPRFPLHQFLLLLLHHGWTTGGGAASLGRLSHNCCAVGSPVVEVPGASFG